MKLPSAWKLAALALAVGGCSAAVPQAGTNSSRADVTRPETRTLPSNLRGITYDDVSNTCAASAQQLASERLLDRPTIRVVFDPVSPSCYATAVSAFDRYGYTMGELIDSSAMKRYTVTQVRARASAYLRTLGRSVDLWEIGNEVNGEWLSSVRCPGGTECAAQAVDVMSKVRAMYDAVSAAGHPTALTLYYEPPQTVTPGYDMLAWEKKYVPAAMHAGVRYVLVSYYETDNDGIRPSPAQWGPIFKQLSADFPNARVGFGEIGMDKPIVSGTLAYARSIFAYYQGLSFAGVPAFTRAGFWWNAAEDLVPSTKWPAFFRDVRGRL